MELKQFLDARFLVPPLILALFAFSANPDKVIDYITGYNSSVLVLLVGAVFLFGIGFMISSLVTALVVIPCNLRGTLTEQSERLFLKIFPFLKNPDRREGYSNTEREAVTWLSISTDKDKYIREQLHKRWHACNASANSIAALVISALVAYPWVGLGEQSCLYQGAWWSLLVALASIFLITARDAYRSVVEIDNIMIRKYNHEHDQ